NKEGLYRLTGLPLGNYTVAISREGFQTVEVKDVVLAVGETRTLDAKLSLGTVTTRVEVEAQANPLEQTSAEMGTVVEREQIANLPINGRNWASMLLLAPGAIDDGGGDQRTIHFAGRARDDNNFTMDGVDATGIQEQAQKSTTRLQISQDAVQEYRVESSLYTAEHGSQAGGQVDLVSKTGTNKFHGSAFDYLRNSVFDARAFNDFDASTGKAIIPPFRLNQFGGSLGGPIIKDKTFFFMDYEGLRQFQGRTFVGAVPAVPLRNAILAKSPQMGPILAAFPVGNVILGQCNNPTTDPCTDNFVHQGASIINEDSWLVRVDHRFTDRTSLYVRASRDLSFTSAPLGNLLDLQAINVHPANYVLTVQHVFSANVVNESKFGINRSPFHNPQIGAFPQNLEVDTNNFEILNNSATDHEVGTTFSFLDNLAITHGRHTFKMGAEIRRVRLNQGITTDSILTFIDNPSLINDNLSKAELRGSWWGRGLRHTFVLPYFQDEWKLRPNLTWNLGVRWEYYSPLTEAHGRMTIFDLDRCKGICPAGSPAYFPNYRNFDPRIGIAWAPKALHERTVVRTGFGIYHGAGQNDDLNASLESNTSRTLLTSTDFANLAYPIDPAILAQARSFQFPRALQRDRRDLYVEEWGLSVQTALPGNFVFQTGYTGSHGVRLFARTQVNLCTVSPNPNCVRPLPGFGEVDIKRNDGNSTFHALNLSLLRRFTSGWLMQGQYMYSHSINDGSIGGGQANGPENVNCRICDKGPSVFDNRHNFVANTVYDLPIGPGRKFWNHTGFVGKLLEGWSLSGLGIWHTGHPLTVLVGLDPSTIPNGEAQSDERPDLVPGVPVVPPGQNSNNWINLNAFAPPPTDANGLITHFGTAGRGLVRAPHVWQMDTGISKTTKLNERLAMQFRADVFNVFNHVQLGDPNQLDILAGSLAQGGNFGVINSTVNFNNNNDNFGPGNTGTGLPRQIQLMLRFTF
ncbi:MAG: TonB-dependent receptor, partial [Candidatus Acidiferrales bacterium]